MPLTSFLGRDDELAELERLLGQARLVTLTGPGGAGKTRLALEVRREHAWSGVRTAYGWPIWPASPSADLVPSLVMEALGVRQSGDVPVMEALRFRLQSAAAATGAGQLRASAGRVRRARRCAAAQLPGAAGAGDQP